jgi:hypothetical protein
MAKGLTPKQIREAQQEGGRQRLGPRIVPKREAQKSNTGYVKKKFPEKLDARNRKIQNTVARASAKNRRNVIEQQAEKYDLSTKMIEHIYRYFGG